MARRVIQRILNPRVLTSLASCDVASNISQALLSGSNFYSVPESILLKWMTYHFARAMPTLARRVTNFSTDLKSGRGVLENTREALNPRRTLCSEEPSPRV